MEAKRTLIRLSFSNPVEIQPKASRAINLTQACPKNISIRTMTMDELEWTRVEWAGNGEGWSSMVGGLSPYYCHDSEGFYIMELGGEKMGSISMIPFKGLKMAFVGYYIIREPHRGKGFGRILMEEVLSHMENDRGITTFGLNCVEAVTPLYEKFGFQTYTKDDFWSLQLQSKDDYRVALKDHKLEDISSFPKALLSYDKAVYGDVRQNYLHAMCSKASTFTIISEERGEVSGYGIISERIPPREEPHKSYRIGPLYANNAETAAEILKGLIASVSETPSTIYLETPGTNPLAAKLMAQFGFNKNSSMAKMYRGTPPEHDEQKIFCYSSVAFG